MAANDYSRRSKKDVFWGDDNNKSKSNELDELIKDEQRTLEEDTETNASEPVCEPVPEPLPEENFDEENFDEEDYGYDGEYDSTKIADDAVPFMTAPGWNGLGYVPSEITDYAPDEIPPEEQHDAHPMPMSITVNKYTPQHQSDTRVDIDIEKFSRDYESQINKLITLKIIALVVVIGAGISVRFWLPIPLSLCIIVTIIGCNIVGSVAKRNYAKIIKELVKRFKVIDLYSRKVEDSRKKVCTDIFDFPEYNAYNCDYYREDLTVIKHGDSTINVAELLVTYTTGSGKSSTTHTLFTGEYYTFAMPKPYADGVLVCNGEMPIAEPDQYFDSKYRFYAINKNMSNSDFGHITYIVDRISEKYGKDFVLFFEDGFAHLIVKTPNIMFFDFGFWDFSVKDNLKRDVKRLAMRVKIAEILSE